MPRRILEGNVVSNKMDKTVTVLVERRYMHPMYKKTIKRTDKYAAHDEGNAFNIGDRVQIEECRPISKRKSWRVITPGTPSAPVKEKAAGKKAAPATEKKVEAKKAAPKKAAAKKTTSKKKDDK